MRSFERFLIYIFLLVFFATAGHQTVEGQNPNIPLNGRVTDVTGVPIINAHLTSPQAGIGAVTKEDGTFEFTYSGEFPLTIAVSAIGYQRKEFVIEGVLLQPLEIHLQEDQRTLQQVEVIGNRITNRHSQRIDPIHVRALPSAAGPGIEGLVRSQMGVSSNNELSSQYRVRGGNFDENLVYVNGQEVYRPFLMHSGQQEGLSFVNPDMVEEVEFSAGGFSASYGDKMSSVLDITYKKPKQTAGSLSAGVLGANGHLEGAAFNQKLTWITGARYKTNRYLLGTLDEKGDYRPNFTDVQAYLTYQLSPRISFELLGYYSLNSYDFEPQDRETTFGTIAEIQRLTVYFEGKEADRFQTGYASFSSNFKVTDQQHYQLTFTGFRTFEEESYDIAGAYWLQEVEDPSSNDEDSGTQIGVGKYMQHARNDLLGVVNAVDLKGQHQSSIGQTNWGLQYRHEAFKDNVSEWELIDSAGYSIPYTGENIELAYLKRANHDLSNHRLSGYLKNQFSYQLSNGQLLVDAGIRASHYSFTSQTTISPRLMLSYLPGGDKNYRIRLSGGYYFQPPFFKEMRRPDGSLNQTIQAQKSIHVVSGYDLYFQKMDRPFKFTTELYYKAMDQLIPYQIDNVRIVYS
ncbi:MAG: carboxypeptidase-like regulatory domain-containing protein, partial [Bacteroidales bacterium]|nr:carboxypeptidase-like regulatory domain-containing protein [Bacteroidales bacterium]